MLASALRTDPHCLRRLEPTDPVIVELREWSRLSEEITTKALIGLARVPGQLSPDLPPHRRQPPVDERRRLGHGPVLALEQWQHVKRIEDLRASAERPGLAPSQELTHGPPVRRARGSCARRPPARRPAPGLRSFPHLSPAAVVTDPPYGLREYSKPELRKLKAGRGGVWRIPPAFDGCQRRPLPRFTVLTDRDRAALRAFFTRFASVLLPVLVPGAHVFIATNPLVSYLVYEPFIAAGFEKRGELNPRRPHAPRRRPAEERASRVRGHHRSCS